MSTIDLLVKSYARARAHKISDAISFKKKKKLFQDTVYNE